MAHTPGPWFLKHNPDYSGSKCRIDNKPDQAWGNFGEIAMVSNEANARLIAAAPELLEAAKKVCEAYEEVPIRYRFSIMDELEEAINKAEGR